MELQQTDVQVFSHTPISVEEGIELIKDLEHRSLSHVSFALVYRFRIGETISRISAPRGQRMDMFKEISKLTGVHENQLRSWLNVYKHFGGDESAFEQYLRTLTKPTEYAVFDLIQANTDPKVLGEKALADRVVNRVERLATDLEQINDLVEQGVIEQEEISPLLQSLHENLSKFKEREDPFSKRVIPRSKEYLNLVRQLPCLVTGSTTVEAHHTEVGGKGIKGSDYSCVPLDPLLHKEYHDLGPSEFERRNDVRIGDLVARTMHLVLTGEDLNLPKT
jgi:hypothetical protein